MKTTLEGEYLIAAGEKGGGADDMVRVEGIENY
jgi:hypothetical protein